MLHQRKASPTAISGTTYAPGYSYDTLGLVAMTSATSAGGNESYQYDATGNRVAQTLNGVSTSSVIDTASNRLLAFGATTYGYDANGNITTVGGTPRYHYDAFNRMDSALGTSFYVNPEGQRLRKSGGETTYFAPDTTGMALADNQAGVWRDYVWLNGRTVAMVMANEVYALHSDQTGRVLAITQPNTALAWKAKGDPFDRNTTSGYSAFFRLGFPGQYWDVEDSLWHNGFRDYDYSTGRYIQSDPIGLAGGINTYVYAESNPVSNIDPLGLLCFDFNQFADDIRKNRFNLDTVLGTLLSDLGVGTMPKTPRELRGFGVPKEELNPITNQLSRWSGRLGTRSLRNIGRSVGGRLLGGAATGALLIEGAYDLYVEGKAAVNATKSNNCDCKSSN
ncbi:RHS repeat-associated core domain-containing protein [Fulvimonas sp. R45]|uniref:RHS repeat-associated core domain-containing protein n=1 Tax=Fulvimonas sp. R45 TaxID=3045937 RepID=UPI00265E6FC0|nr:RHS repeat-associated core domain-containing protein [Fulvimonas sp. R45]MDO1527227.1 RHS repeat-associated core domain-containing protein [Fulvimonas sp. R45]